MIYRAIVNALIPPVDYPASLLINRSDWGQVLWAIKQGVPHYIRHRGTVNLLGVSPLESAGRGTAMNDVERERMRENLLRLVREEPEMAAGLLLGLMDGGRFEVVIREERVEQKDLTQVGFSSWETNVMGCEIERKG